jgi:hypothetical protein
MKRLILLVVLVFVVGCSAQNSAEKKESKLTMYERWAS